MKKKTDLQLAQEKAEKSAKLTNEKIDLLGEKTKALADNLNEIQSVFDEIRGIPSDKKHELEEMKKIRLNWTQQVKKIAADYKAAEAKAAGAGVTGASAGIAVAALGPTAAMGVATTFGVASTGTAISTLSGAAATNAALAWLGGGALTAGGGGIAAGNALLLLAGPVGWAIASVAVFGSGLLFFKGRGEKKRLEKIYISISNRDEKSYKLAVVELNERIKRIVEETQLLFKATEISRSYGIDYDSMSEEQQYKLSSFVNLMNSSTQLLVNPILGLQPRFTEGDFSLYSSKKRFKNIIVALANLLYKIELDDTDKKLLWKSLRKNKNFLKDMGISDKEFEFELMSAVESALENKYNSSK